MQLAGAWDMLCRYNEELQLFTYEDSLLVAVSGGMDSMLLLDLLHRNGMALGVAHVNYHMRGEESDKDEAVVRTYCNARDIPIHVEHYDLKTDAENDGSIQLKARQLRYAWFDRLSVENGYDYIATAHHIDDTIETILINQLRGTGSAGLSGIPAKRGKIIRPLLCLNRIQIKMLVDEHDIPYRIDSSNQSDAYLRNRIRHHILPAFKIAQPDYESRILSNARRIEKEVQSAQDMALYLGDQVSSIEDGTHLIDLKKLLATPAPEFILYTLTRQFGFNLTQCETIISSERQTGAIVQSGTYTMLRDRELLRVMKRMPGEKVYIELFPGESLQTLKGLLQSKTGPAPQSNTTDGNTAYFDIALLATPLILRNWRSGDRIEPYGMTGSQSVSDILTNRKVPHNDRDSVLVLDDGEDILWIVGHRRSRKALLGDATNSVLQIEWIPT